MVSEIGGEILLPKNPPTATLVVHKKLDTSQNVELHFYPTRTKRLGRSYHWILDLLQAVLGRVVVVSIGSKKAAHNGNISFPYNIFYVGERKTCWDKLEQFEKGTAGETRKWGQGARKDIQITKNLPFARRTSAKLNFSSWADDGFCCRAALLPKRNDCSGNYWQLKWTSICLWWKLLQNYSLSS